MLKLAAKRGSVMALVASVDLATNLSGRNRKERIAGKLFIIVCNAGTNTTSIHERVVCFAGARLAALFLRHAVSVILLHNRTLYLLLTNDSKSYL